MNKKCKNPKLKEWTNDEIMVLTEKYKEMTFKQLADLIGRTTIAVKRKLYSLGLKRGTKEKWTEEDIMFLKEHKGEMRHEDIAKNLGRSLNSVLLKSSRLNK